MELLKAVVLGIIEGATEYLPISSTFHLIWTAKLLKVESTEFQKAFEVIIQGGSILAVFLLYGKQILLDRNLIKKVGLAFLPTAIAGLLLYRIIKYIFFENTLLQLSVFILVGFIFIIWERGHQKERLVREIKDLTIIDCLLLGIAQAFAIIPGVSRAGAVILFAMFVKVKRDEAAKFSFLLAIPTLLAASGFDLYKNFPAVTENGNSIILLATGFIASFFSALLFVKWFIGFISKKNLEIFGWYRLILGLLLLSFLNI